MLKIIGATLGWDMKPHLCFEDGSYLFGNGERIIYKEYFQNGDFPTDPITKEKLPIVDLREIRRKEKTNKPNKFSHFVSKLFSDLS